MIHTPHLLVVTLAVLTTACATPVATTGTAPAWTSASFTMNSWGHPLTTWQVNSDGSGTWTESLPRNGQFNDRVTTTHTLPADPTAAAQLAARLASLPATAPSDEHCKERITDQPYGELTLTYAATVKQYRYNAGCLDAPYRRFLHQLRAANEQVAARGRAEH